MLNGQQIDIPFFRHIKLMSLGDRYSCFFHAKEADGKVDRKTT
ncbi:Uncharacterised protein [Escherichia coli]|uniref:Uncharacterized protein n=1 Tax=Escherichia coli TaxID=562 RepID=A0A376LMP4_ECOLX|nr:Uncharacterised protein [Escherichia coli]